MDRERDVEKWLKKEIEGLGGEFWKFTSPGRDGVPDRIAMFPDGRLVFVELKTTKGKPTKVQRYQIGVLLAMRRQVCIVRGKRAAKEFLEDMMGRGTLSLDYFSDGSRMMIEEWKKL